MRLFTLMLVTLLSMTILMGQVVITEIMYNPPESGQDIHEFIELYNSGAAAVDMTGYSFAAGVDYTFDAYSLGAGEYVMVAVNSDAFQTAFGMTALQWTGGSLSNGGELIQLVDAVGVIIDEVMYDDGGDWSGFADGNGTSLVLCDVMADNNMAANWAAANTGTGFIAGGVEIFATPGTSVACVTGPTIGFVETEIEAEEESGSVTFRIAISNADLIVASHTIEVMATASSTASVPADLNFSPSSFTFDSGQAADTMSLTVNIIDDEDIEALEHITFELVNPSADLTVIGVIGQATLSILDNDSEVADIVINEIMYNPPGSDAMFEYLELHNNSDVAVNMAGYYFESGVEKVFHDVNIMPGGFLVVAVDSVAFEATYSATALQWTSGGLGNGGETIELRDALGNIVDVVTYDDAGDWPTEPDGSGKSLILCDPSSDNNLAASWIAATQSFDIFISGAEIFGSPDAPNDCSPAEEEEYVVYPIAIVTTTDADGVVDSLGTKVELTGVVHGVNLHPNGLLFTVIDAQNDGIAVFSGGNNYGYTVNEGDEVSIQGSISQFNGLAQVFADSVWMNSAGNPLQEVLAVTALNEDTESQLIELLGVTITDVVTAGGGLNLTLLDENVETFTVRVDFDTDITEDFVNALGAQVLNITGIGGQFDNSSPYFDGYQLLPRYQTDIEVVSVPNDYTVYPIATVTTTDADGVVDSLGTKAELTGIVHGVNLRSTGLLFTIIDAQNDGIAIFSGGNDYGYTVNEGDEVTIQGTISQFNGLAQISADSVWMNSAANPLQDVLAVTALDEDTESQLVQLVGVTITDVLSAGGGLNLTVVESGGETYIVRIDLDTDITEEFVNGFGSQPLIITGLGGQFDSSSPYTEGYQLLPRYTADITPVVSVSEPKWAASVQLFPVPVTDFLRVQLSVEADEIIVTNALGQLISREQINLNDFTVNTGNWPSGVYYLQIINQNERVVRKIVKE